MRVGPTRERTRWTLDGLVDTSAWCVGEHCLTVWTKEGRWFRLTGFEGPRRPVDDILFKEQLMLRSTKTSSTFIECRRLA